MCAGRPFCCGWPVPTQLAALPPPPRYDMDFIFASFVQCAEDVRTIRKVRLLQQLPPLYNPATNRSVLHRNSCITLVVQLQQNTRFHRCSLPLAPRSWRRRAAPTSASSARSSRRRASSTLTRSWQRQTVSHGSGWLARGCGLSARMPRFHAARRLAQLPAGSCMRRSSTSTALGACTRLCTHAQTQPNARSQASWSRAVTSRWRSRLRRSRWHRR